MPEELTDAESILLEKIQNSIYTDGFPEEIVQNYLQNGRVSIPGLRLKMVEMLRMVPEAYAACYFEILADIQVQCEDGLIPKNTVADLSQESMQAVRNMAAGFYPVQRLRDLIRETGETTGHVPKPYALHKELYDWLDERNRKAESAEKKQVSQDRAWKKDMAEQCAMISEQFSGLSDQVQQNRKLVQDQVSRIRDLQRKAEEQKDLTGAGKAGAETMEEEPPGIPAGIVSFIGNLLKRKKQKEKPDSEMMKELLFDLKRQEASPVLMREVKEAIRHGVSIEEIRYCLRETGGGEYGEQTAVEVLQMYAVRKEQEDKKKEG